MIRPVSKIRPAALLNDFQVFKGQCSQTMKPFGAPVTAAHEAYLLIRDDRSKLTAGESPMYAIHQRSENRIVKIMEHVRQVVTLRPRTKGPSAFPLPKAA